MKSISLSYLKKLQKKTSKALTKMKVSKKKLEKELKEH